MAIKMILVFEDKEEERVKALSALKQAFAPDEEELTRFDPIKGCEQVGFGVSKIMVMFANDFEWARNRLEFAKRFVGSESISPAVITDLMFPMKTGDKEEPNGMRVLAECITMGLPVVMCSDTDHHDVNYLMEVFPILAKAHPKEEIPLIFDKKDWSKAVSELRRICGW